jgi:hemin uptake protein HemP
MSPDDDVRPGRRLPPPHTAPPVSDPPRKIDARDLFRGDREVVIQHAGAEYRLRLTRAGKLILYK